PSEEGAPAEVVDEQRKERTDGKPDVEVEAGGDRVLDQWQVVEDRPRQRNPGRVSPDPEAGTEAEHSGNSQEEPWGERSAAQAPSGPAQQRDQRDAEICAELAVVAGEVTGQVTPAPAAQPLRAVGNDKAREIIAGRPGLD